MLERLRSRLTYANVMATVAVFLGLATGGAYAAATITGADVVDGSLTGVDVQDESLKREDIAKNSIGTGKVIDNDLTGADVHDDALTGADLNESTLGTVPDAAKLGGRAVDDLFVTAGTINSTSCNPTSTTLIDCGSLDAGISESGGHEFYATATFEWFGASTGGSAGRCRLISSGLFIDETKFGQKLQATDATHPQTATLAGRGLTSQPFTVQCAETDADIRIQNIRISVVHAPFV